MPLLLRTQLRQAWCCDAPPWHQCRCEERTHVMPGECGRPGNYARHLFHCKGAPCREAKTTTRNKQPTGPQQRYPNGRPATRNRCFATIGCPLPAAAHDRAIPGGRASSLPHLLAATACRGRSPPCGEVSAVPKGMRLHKLPRRACDGVPHRRDRAAAMPNLMTKCCRGTQAAPAMT